MSKQYPGGIISKTPPVPTQVAASGVWTLDQQAYWQKLGQWPAPPLQISRSLRFNSADSANLSRTFGTPTNANVWTFSCWIKRSVLGGYSTILGRSGNTYPVYQFITSTNTFGVYDSGSANTTAVFRDPSAWYHLVIQRTDSTTVTVYFNGVNQLTSTGQTNAFNLSGSTYTIGKSNAGEYFDGYMTEVNFIDGQALTPASFGYTDANTGVWTPYPYTGAYGTNGFYLNFSDNSNTTAATLGKDYSGNGNNWTPNNFSVTAGAGNDSLVDSPTSYGVDTGVGGSVRGNYCTLNPLDKASEVTLANGNLDVTWSNVTGHSIRSTMAMKYGKWYTEFIVGGNSSIGIATQLFNMTSWVGSDANSWGYAPDGRKVTGSSYSSFGTALANGNIVGIAFDADSGKLWFSLNGTWQASGSPSTGANPAFTVATETDYFLAIGYWTSPTSNVNSLNAGQRPFAYTAPSGFKALCTQNLPTPTIGATSATTADKYFNIKLYTGNGSAGNAQSGLGFQPDFLWFKSRNAARSHGLFNAVMTRTFGLASESTNAEYTSIAGRDLASFDSDGFTVGVPENFGSTNTSGDSIVAWAWKANGSGSSNTAGSITSTVSANTTSGFSVVTYTGTGANATVGHGIGIAPSMVIIKARSFTQVWVVGHSSIGFGNYLLLNATDASASGSNVFNSTAPTSTVFSLGSGGGGNQSAATYVAYCFAPIAGYSAFGSYTGNGSTDGPFVFTGMRPAYVMVKRTDANGDWRVWDVARETYNVMSTPLYPNDSSAEASSSVNNFDVLSNGFKVRNATAAINANGGAYIYMAFASSPFKFSLAR